MRTTKGILAAALIAPTLALTGGLAYASTTGSPATPAQPAVVTTVQAHGQHTTGQPRHDHCDHPATRHHSTGGHHGYQGRNGHGYQGGYGGNHCGDDCGW